MAGYRGAQAGWSTALVQGGRGWTDADDEALRRGKQLDHRRRGAALRSQRDAFARFHTDLQSMREEGEEA
eukprot:gene2114-15380_t